MSSETEFFVYEFLDLNFIITHDFWLKRIKFSVHVLKSGIANLAASCMFLVKSGTAVSMSISVFSGHLEVIKSSKVCALKNSNQFSYYTEKAIFLYSEYAPVNDCHYYWKMIWWKVHAWFSFAHFCIYRIPTLYNTKV